MINEQPLGAQIFIPTLTRSVFKNKIFILIQRIWKFHRFISCQILLIEHGKGIIGVFSSLLYLDPSHEFLFISWIADRRISIVVVGTAVHQRPRAHTEISIVGVIKIRQPKTMWKLMAECADSIYLWGMTTIQLIKACKLINLSPVKIQRFLIIWCRKIPLAWPDWIFSIQVVRGSLPVAGIKNDENIAFSISVIIIEGIINFRIQT